MPPFDFVVSSLSTLQAKVHETPLLFAAFTTIVYWTVISYYHSQTRKVITMAYLLGAAERLNVIKHSLNISVL
jgi:hypothetical protein